MGKYLELLPRGRPKTDQEVAKRKQEKLQWVGLVETAKQYGQEYFDGDRKFGYGGYKYDGRWRKVMRYIHEHYNLDSACKVLDVGCGKGFLVADFLPWADAYGLDISRYAVVEQPHYEAVGRLHLGSADSLPFPDKSFDLVLSINTLHNLPRPRLLVALQEMRRVCRSSARCGGMFVQVDSYNTPEEEARFKDWVLTAETHGTPAFWQELFAEAGYDGDYAWTTV